MKVVDKHLKVIKKLTFIYAINLIVMQTSDYIATWYVDLSIFTTLKIHCIYITTRQHNQSLNAYFSTVSSPESNERSDNMFSIIIGIVVAVVVVAFVIIAVLLVIVVCKLQGNRHNSKGTPKYNIYMHIAMVIFCFHFIQTV